MKNETIIKGKEYSLDLGASAPVEVRVLEIIKDTIKVEYLNSTPGRIETFSRKDFEYFI
ncbi:hypothetical protein Phi14:2_gp030 [Cellulophaga phage phi14:2]|uniref:Uncharacterized protein n=1 Tax=Cellulophaga phage phi14:2 TaxID=1327990 RepID=S0A3U9_9CAUD|nr:hypothetical protein Phi14:2_gp030 [Cellulophaga phage phi14:2]